MVMDTYHRVREVSKPNEQESKRIRRFFHSPFAPEHFQRYHLLHYSYYFRTQLSCRLRLVYENNA